MSRYSKLANWLREQGQDRIELGLSEIERIIGAPLPRSAAKYHAYWSPGNHVGNILLQCGWRARPDLSRRKVAFVKEAVPSSESVRGVQNDSWAKLGEQSADAPDLVLVGCVKSKRSGRHQARYLYTSDLFKGRRARAEETGKPWFILSAKYGLVSPDAYIDSYDLALADVSTAKRRDWAKGVLRELEKTFGPLKDRTVEIHAGAEYVQFGLLHGLRERGARVIVALAALRFGEQLSWYSRQEGGEMNQVGKPRLTIGSTEEILAISEGLTKDFMEGRLDLSKRPGSPEPGWEAMPEFVAARLLRASGIDPPGVRVFITLVSALDRARDADRLWRAATSMYEASPWVFDPKEVRSRSLHELRSTLVVPGVSQRHTVDTAAWKFISEALTSEDAPKVVCDAVFKGEGNASELLEQVKANDGASQPWFPYLSGPKVSAMWVRMLVAPGSATISNLDEIPVAVDVQVRKVTENLGVTDTLGQPIEGIRTAIQKAWRQGAPRAVGPSGLASTSAALDPALWFFGKWGCSFCERWGHREPITDICQRCRLSN